MNPKIPIMLGAENESIVRLCGELCDDFLPLGFVPSSVPHYRTSLEEGFRRAGGGKSLDNFEILPMVPVVIDRDVKAAMNRMKPDIALYAGGMGARRKNFHNELMVRQRFPEAAARIQELFLAGRKEEAAATVPDELIDLRALVGTPDRIRTRYRAWEDSGATGLLFYKNTRTAHPRNTDWRSARQASNMVRPAEANPACGRVAGTRPIGPVV